MKKLNQFEAVNMQKEVPYHNTVCHKKCLRVCHQHCGVAYSQDSAVLTGCLINHGGKCQFCGCPTTEHQHARVEYVTEKQETAEYQLLLNQIATCKDNEGGKQAEAMADTYKKQMQQFDDELF